MFITSNGGTNWTAVPVNNNPLPIGGEFGITGGYSAVGDTIWFGTNKGRVYKSVDKGFTWDVHVVPALTGDYLIPVFRDGSNGLVHNFIGQAFVGCNPAAIYETFDGGETWQAVTSLGSMYAFSIAHVPEMGNAWISSGGWIWGESGVSISYDGGHHWYDFPGTNGAKFRAMSWVNNSCGWAGSYSLNETEWGVYKFEGNLLPWPTQIIGDTVYNDVYLSWGTLSANNLNITALGYNIYRDGIKLNSSPIIETNYNDQNVSNGIYNYCVTAIYEEGESNSSCVEVVVDVSTMVNENEESSIYIYPNPFSTSITIQFGHTNPENITINIFNYLGQLVESMDQGNLKTGKHQYIWDASDITSGVYFVQVRIGKETTTRKIVKMK